jgi:hypothetical protein
MKIKINSTPLFQQVASVVGNYQAHIEISKLKIKDLEKFALLISEKGSPVNPWNRTPQGFEFWREIHQVSKRLRKISNEKK